MVLLPVALRAECAAETGVKSAVAVFTLHLPNTCTEAEREARAVSAQELLRALAAGKGLDLSGVVIQGDLVLDELAHLPDHLRQERTALLVAFVMRAYADQALSLIPI